MIEQAASLSSSLPPLVLQALRLAETLTTSGHGHQRAGIGDSFFAYRPYSAQENAASIDWRASARMPAPVVREREHETPQTLYLWVDNSPSMDYRSKDDYPTKGEAARLLALSLAAMLFKGNENVGTLDGQVKPTNAASQLVRFYDAFSNAEPLNLPQLSNASSRAHVLMVGDLLPQADETTAWLQKHLRSGMTLSFIEVCDVVEDTFRFEGPTRFRGLEKRDGSLEFLAPQDVRQQYLKRRSSFRDILKDQAKRSGGHYFTYRTDTDIEDILLQLYQYLGQPRG